MNETTQNAITEAQAADHAAVLNALSDSKPIVSKVVRVGTVAEGRWMADGYAQVSVFCKINFNGSRLSITGVVGPQASGNCWGSCGQINPVKVDHLAPGWTPQMLARFNAIWERYHLNDMRAGTVKQTEFLRQHAAEFPGYPVSYYDWARELLTKAGLNPDGGYRYGSAWLHEEVPADVVEFLTGLPNADEQPAWV